MALIPASANAQVSAQDAKNMPLRNLASKVLGTAGSLMIEVERPRWGERFSRMPASAPWPPADPPPLHRLLFFGHGVVTGSQFGLCGSDWVTVNFEDNGRVESIQAERRYGVEGPIYRKPGEWTYEESGDICDAVKTTRAYFPAPGAQEALEIALYVDAISGRGSFAKQTFTFQCDGICGQGRSVLSALKLKDIDHAREIDCNSTTLKLPSCYELVIGDNQVGPFPKKFRIYGSNYMNKLVVSSVKVHVGSTVE